MAKYSQTNYLQHYGILGMKWGIRRYQNEDGSLTEEGRIRYSSDRKFANKLDSYRKKNGLSAVTEVSKPKTISEMSDNELQKYVNRKTAERTAYQAQADIARLNPKKKSIGEEFVEKTLKEALIPAVTKAGKDYLEKYLKEATGTNEQKKPDKYEQAQKDMKYWTNLNTADKQRQEYEDRRKGNKKTDASKSENKTESTEIKKESEKTGIEKTLSDLGFKNITKYDYDNGTNDRQYNDDYNIPSFANNSNPITKSNAQKGADWLGYRKELDKYSGGLW